MEALHRLFMSAWVKNEDGCLFLSPPRYKGSDLELDLCVYKLPGRESREPN